VGTEDHKPPTASDCVVLIVEDDADYAQRIIAPHFDSFWTTRLAYNIPSALAALDEIDELCAAIVDLNLPGGSPFDPDRPNGFGFEVVEHARKLFPSAPVVVFTAHLTPDLVNAAHRLGAEYLVKGASDDDLQRLACRFLLQTHPEPFHADAFVKRMHDECGLSQRQTQVVAFALRGMQNQEIADSLGISVNTLKRHVAAILEKCDIDSLSGLTRRFLRGR